MYKLTASEKASFVYISSLLVISKSRKQCSSILSENSNPAKIKYDFES